MKTSKRIFGLANILLFFSIACGCGKDNRSVRLLYPESKLSVLEIELQTYKFDGLDSGIARDHSAVGIRFEGFARLGIDLSKSKFEQTQNGILVIELPPPEITEVSINETEVWDRWTNEASGEKLDEKEVELCNAALKEFSEIANDPFYIDLARRTAKRFIRNFYNDFNPDISIEFK